MLRLTPLRRRRVSNGLAIFGAFLLAASVLAGGGNLLGAAEQHAGALPDSESVAAQNAAIHPAQHKKTRKFRVNLFLFRH